MEERLLSFPTCSQGTLLKVPRFSTVHAARFIVASQFVQEEAKSRFVKIWACRLRKLVMVSMK